jgi:HEAT repeat protein
MINNRERNFLRLIYSDYIKEKPYPLAIVVLLATMLPGALYGDQKTAARVNSIGGFPSGHSATNHAGKSVSSLPLLDNDMMELASLMGGAVSQADTVYGNSQQNFTAAIARLQSADLNERADALVILQRPGASAAIPVLIQMLGNDTEFPAIRLVVRNDMPITQYCDRTPTFGGEAAEAIAKIGRISDELLALLTSANWRIRANAARALGGLKDKRAVESLINLLSTPAEPWQVRGNAALALGLIGDARASGPLITLLQDTNPDVRRAATTALGERKDPGNLDLFIKMLGDPESDVRRWAVVGIGRIGGAAAFEHLSKAALHDEDRVVREVATNVLAGIRDPRSAAVFASALQDSYINVRNAAARGLGQLHSVEAVDTLIRMLSSDESASRQAAAEALSEIGDPRAVNPIINMLIHENSRDWYMVVLRGLQALSRLGHKGAAEMLNKHSSPLVREWWDRNKGQLLN